MEGKPPLAVELYAGTGSGTAGWCELGGTAVCFDLEYLDHHGAAAERSHRVVQDVLTLNGAQFKDARFIWGSSPCQAYSWLAMPWSRSKCPLCKGTKLVFEWQLVVGVMKGKTTELGKLVPCDCKENSAKAKDLRRRWELDGPDNTLFDSVSRIQREASAAAGRIIPFVQENVRGAVPWVGKRDMSLAMWKSLTQAERVKAGRPDATFGSFFLWGHVAQIGNRVVAGRDLVEIRAGHGRFGMGVAPEKAVKVEGFRFDGSGRSFQTALVEQSGVKLGGGKSWSDFGKPGYKAFGFNTENEKRMVEGVKVSGQIQGKEYAMCRTGAAGQMTLGVKVPTDGEGRRTDIGKGARFTSRDCGVEANGTKNGDDWFSDPNSTCRKHGSKSNARKAASAMIAKIPYALSRYIAEQHMPQQS